MPVARATEAQWSTNEPASAMKLTEFQILMPMTVDEFLVAHLYTVVKYSPSRF